MIYRRLPCSIVFVSKLNLCYAIQVNSYTEYMWILILTEFTAADFFWGAVEIVYSLRNVSRLWKSNRLSFFFEYG